VRARLEPIAARAGARIKVAEVPPGPPVQETLVAEVYGPDQQGRDLFRETSGVVDVDWYVEDDQARSEMISNARRPR